MLSKAKHLSGNNQDSHLHCVRRKCRSQKTLPHTVPKRCPFGRVT